VAHALDLPALEAARRVRDPRDPLTARALVDGSLARIEARDGEVQAFLAVTPELARAQAEVVDARVARGEDPGPLAGLPLAVKDNLAVRGVPLTCASRILEGYVPPDTATAVERAVAAGCCVVGKTNLDEFAMGSSTENSAFGPTRNPHDPARVPGGSSGGSAAAVAAGMVPLALGSDTGGSVRQPAALCGVVGFKPTYGRVSRSGLVAFASSLDQVGTFAREVGDAAALLDAIAGPDRRDATSAAFPHPVRATAAGAGAGSPSSLRGLRVGLVREMVEASEGGDREVAAAFARVRERLRDEGAVEVDLSVPLAPQAIPVYYVLAPAEASSNLARYDGVRYGHAAQDGDLEAFYGRTRAEGFGAEVKRRILIGTFALSAGYADAYYQRAMRVRAALRAQMDEALSRADVLLSATTPSPAFRLGEKTDDPLAMYLSDVLTVAANLAGVPAISLPAGRTRAGLPVGAQVWGARGREDVLLAASAAIETAIGEPWTPAEARA
jgi:aspartyl-tRNA(Asn)/glutamyl-tRNA(Gln) amidotransferase subunit A